MFKVPSLRNVAVTPPYFHDASARTLEEAIVVMARYQLGRLNGLGRLAPDVRSGESRTGFQLDQHLVRGQGGKYLGRHF